MPDDKGLGSKILGLFVEKDGETPASGTEAVEGEKSAADLVAELANQGGAKAGQAQAGRAPPAQAPAPMPAIPKPTGPVTPATVDFESVFKNAGMDGAELESVRKAEDLLKSLPEATPHDVKKQIVEASLKAFGHDIVKIAAGAQNQLKALDTYVRLNEQQTSKAITDLQKQIAQLEDKIIGLRADITKRTETLAGLAAAAEARKSQVQRVLDFFHVPPSAAPPASTGPTQ